MVMSARRAGLDELAALCRGPWRASLPAAAPTGFPELDANLPGGGWPMGALCELMPETAGIGELSLLLPALCALAQAGRHIAWIAPPYLPYAPALVQHGLSLERLLMVEAPGPQESLWAAEQALRCPAFGAVLSWPSVMPDRSVRRLQLAAEAGGSLGILYRPAEAHRQHSPAALRLRLRPAREELIVFIHKCRGGRAGLQLHLALPLRATAGPADAVAVHPAATPGA
jgi:cell division inhibitor SulA/protein ImuA